MLVVGRDGPPGRLRIINDTRWPNGAPAGHALPRLTLDYWVAASRCARLATDPVLPLTPAANGWSNLKV